jgi:ankyrin repeat protein
MDLFDAIAAGDTAAADDLLATDPTLGSARHASGATPVLYALYRGRPDLARHLATRVAARNLAEAAALDDTDRVTDLLDAGADVDARTPDGFTPLHLAAFFGAPRVAALLLRRGADAGAVADNPMRVQPLNSAAAGRHHEIAVALIAAGADIDARQEGGHTPLLAAAGNGDADLARTLLAAGADPTLARDDGVGPADLARAQGHDALADELAAATSIGRR